MEVEDVVSGRMRKPLENNMYVGDSEEEEESEYSNGEEEVGL